MKPLHGLVPLASFQDVERSIEFYRRLGFEEINRHTPEGESAPVWAWLRSGDANLMVSREEEPDASKHRPVLFYIYCEDIPGFHAELKVRGVEVGAIVLSFRRAANSPSSTRTATAS